MNWYLARLDDGLFHQLGLGTDRLRFRLTFVDIVRPIEKNSNFGQRDH